MKTTAIMENSSDEFEQNLIHNTYSVAYDVLRKRYVKIKTVYRNEHNKILIVAKTYSDTKYHTYQPHELSFYEL
jgi:hypothetical protein